MSRLIELARIGKKFEDVNSKRSNEITTDENKKDLTNKLFAKMHKYFNLKSKDNKEAMYLEKDIAMLIEALKVV